MPELGAEEWAAKLHSALTMVDALHSASKLLLLWSGDYQVFPWVVEKAKKTGDGNDLWVLEGISRLEESRIIPAAGLPGIEPQKFDVAVEVVTRDDRPVATFLVRRDVEAGAELPEVNFDWHCTPEQVAWAAEIIGGIIAQLPAYQT